MQPVQVYGTQEILQTRTHQEHAPKAIAKEARENPGMLHEAPHVTYVGRLDETAAAKFPVLRWDRGT